MELLSIIFTALLSFGTFGASLFGLHHLWLKPHTADIPAESTATHRRLMRQKSLNEDDYIKVRTLSEMLKVYLPLILTLEPKYWAHNVGLDGYAYLYYQKELIKTLIMFGIVSFVMLVPVSIWFESMQSEPQPGAQTGDITIESYRNNKEYNMELRSIIDCLLLYFFCLYTIYSMFRIKSHLREELAYQKKKRMQNYEYEVLRARSVHVKGVFPEDRKGETLCEKIGKFLEETGEGGKIMACIVVPDFVEIVGLENYRKRVDDAQKLLVANEPAVRRMFFPKKYRDESYYEKKLKRIDDKIDVEIMKPVICSGHAFICFDTVKTRNICLEHFREDTKHTFEAFWKVLSKKNSVVSRDHPMLKRKVTSTFQKFNDTDIALSLKAQDLSIVMNPLESPVEIFWANLGGTRGFFFLRRIGINIIAVLILVFLSTPASLLTALKQIEILKFLDVSQYAQDDSTLGNFLKQTIPPILIICLNQLLLLLIDYAAYMQKHRTFTSCQLSIFYKSLFYLSLNMLIIPALTLATADSLFKMVIYEGRSIATILKQFYFSSPGSFFINILLQNGGFSSSFHLLRIADIINAFGSTWLAHYQRTYLNDLDKWRKKESDVFQYGYLYAQILTLFAITISYSVSMPAIILAGIAFLLMRYSVDGFNLLTVFKVEVDSEGGLIEPILMYTASATLLLEIALSISFGASGYKISCALCSLLFVITIYLMCKLSGPIDIGGDEAMDDPVMEREDTRDHLDAWKTAYRHPLLVSSTEGTGPRDTQVFSVVFE